MGQHASRIRYSHDADAMQMEPYGQANPLKRAPYIQTQRVDEHEQLQQEEEEDPPSQSPYSRWTTRFSLLRRRGVIRRNQERRELPYPTFRRTKTGEEKEKEAARNRYLHAFFQEFDLVFVVDDSTSMLGDRWREVENALAGMTPLCAAHNPEGVDVYFVNHWARQGTGSGTGSGGEDDDDEDEDDEGDLGGYTNLTTAPQIHSVFSALHPTGRTPFGARLSHLLLPYLRLVENLTIANADAATTADGDNHPVRCVKPLYIIGITDGAFTDDAEEILLQAARRLEGCRATRGQVKVQFFHVGEDEGARRFLEALQTAVRRREGHEGITRDVLAGDGDFTTGKRLTADGMVRRMCSTLDC